MSGRSGGIAAAALALSLCVPAAVRAQATSAAERIRQVETSLLPSIQVRGRTYQPVPLAERMRQLRVPAVSIAVIHDGRLEWARAYGYADVAARTPATTETLFQAASMSKPVAAMGALKLVEQGRLALDRDVNTWLTSWRVPQDSFTARQPVTLAHLLTHSAGLTVHGFPGYAAGAPLPTLVQVLDGAPPANTAAVRVDQLPGGNWRYSGGGITVMQQLVQDVTGEPFPAFMERAVLRPLGMNASTYQQPLPAGLAPRAATAYRANGEPVEGRFHVYPEMAAAGLWTTASDLARFVMDVQSTVAGASSTVLSRPTATEMLRARIGGWGLGIGVRPAGSDVVFEHGGANEGYRGNFFGYVGRGEGAAVLTNSDAGDVLVREILQALGRAYGWAAFPVQELVPAAVAPELLQACVGEYQLGNVRVSVSLESGMLYVLTPDGARSELVPVGGDWFVVAASGQRVRAERDATGRVLALASGGVRLPRASTERPPAPAGEQLVALTFDDGPSDYTPRLLDVLDSLQVKATFLFLGVSVERHPELVRAIRERGHELGSHTYSHPHLGSLSRTDAEAEMARGIDLVRQAAGQGPTVFRAPFGEEPAWLLEACRQLGVARIPLGVAGQDWVDGRPAAQIAAAIVANVKPGSFILLHDGSDVPGADRSRTVAAVPLIVSALHAKGYRFVTASALLAADSAAGR